MTARNAQEDFWARDYALNYIRKNSEFDVNLGASAWRQMLRKTSNIKSYLELGCNIGRNLTQLKITLPDAQPSIVEISTPAFDFVNSTFDLQYAFNGSIIESSLPSKNFDLAFTCGVLIHIHPKDLLENMQKLFSYSKKYVLIAEYFNRTPVSIEYQGQAEKLFKQDFGKLFIKNFDTKLIDYGFLWGHIYDKAGFDDITWWLFEKNSNDHIIAD
jgi:pseudaminic acid biosynthesis-associated methylase